MGVLSATFRVNRSYLPTTRGTDYLGRIDRLLDSLAAIARASILCYTIPVLTVTPLARSLARRLSYRAKVSLIAR
jgi:hypothetical protein